MMFEVAAAAYDEFMGRWSRLLAVPFADFAGIDTGQRVLDVGCGPGALTAELVARLGAGQVCAVDPSESFVEAARARNPGVEVVRATAEALPYPDAAFDAALAQLVVHFMSDPVAGLGDMRRVTRAGGVVAACVWDYGLGRGPLGPFWATARELDASVEDELLRAGTRRGHLAELFTAAGLRDVEATELAVEREFESFDGWWEPFTRGVGPAGAFVARLDDERRRELKDRCRSILGPGPFRAQAVAWAARGVVA